MREWFCGSIHQTAVNMMLNVCLGDTVPFGSLGVPQ
jgi:hypothetical protein